MMKEIYARIGMVNFINTAPLYEIWQETVQRPDWQVTEGAPSALNQLLFADKLDLGFISSHEYAAHPHKYKILSDLSISATGPVGSVLLFSNKSLADLGGETVLLSSQSQTSVSLVKIVLEKFYGQQPVYKFGALSELTAGEDEYAAIMAIGDEALRLAAEDRFAHAYDLGKLWQDHTKLPFVFAVWAVREEFCKQQPEVVVEIHHELLRCVHVGKGDLQAISARVAPRVPMAVDKCYEYLCGMEYDLGPQKIAALELFFRYLIERGEAPAAALPLKICG